MKKNIFYFLLLSTFLFSCKTKKASYIIVSKDNHKHVTNWLKANNFQENIKIAYLINSDSLSYFLKHASGIIISGGNDVNPLLYSNDSSQLMRCGKIDYYRDSLEQSLIQNAFKNKIPLLGICRGNQIINVTFGGSLVIDIPSDIKKPLIHRANKDSLVHQVYFTEVGKSIVNMDSAWTNSRHHQAVKNIAPNFSILAKSSDNVIEGIYYTQTNHPFILGVQFHPEDIYNPISDTIASRFHQEIIKFQKK